MTQMYARWARLIDSALRISIANMRWVLAGKQASVSAVHTFVFVKQFLSTNGEPFFGTKEEKRASHKTALQEYETSN